MPATSAAAVGLKDVTTGDTLSDPEHVIHPGAHGLSRTGDLAGGRGPGPRPTRKDGRGPAPAGAGGPVGFGCRPTPNRARPSSPAWAELHLEILVDRMRREFGVEASVGKPEVA